MLDDKEILIRLSKGDDTVFKDIFEKYYSLLCKYVYARFLRNREDTEEIVQNIFLKLWEKRNELSKIDTLKPYLYRSASNACINYFEHEAVKRKFKGEAEYKLKMMEFSVEENNSKEEKLDSAINEINGLPEQTRRIFNLKYINGLKYKEIADELNISEKTVQTLIYRGLKQLRNKLLLILLFMVLKFSVLYDILMSSK